ncbi:MAG: replicative DNA helicase [Dehalococcoidales bacterium]|nr:replicative DNA helicase [Dehalococcoidales bacterium]
MDGVKLPPHDLDAEEAVIGSLLIDGMAIHKVADFLQAPDFHYEQNQWLFGACLELYQRNEAIDQITLAQELSRQGKLEPCGGAAHLSHLISICPTSLDIEHYAQIVYRLSMMRRLIMAGDRIGAIGYEAGPDVEESLAKAENLLFDLRRGQSTRDLTHIRTLLDKYFEAPPTQEERARELPYVLSSFTGLDTLLSGFQRSDLVIIGGRPSMGKSSLAFNIARNAAVEHKAVVALFSLEMARDSLVLRFLSSESGLDSRNIRAHTSWGTEIEHGDHWEQEEEKIMKATGVLSEASIYIDDTPMLRLSEMRSKALRLSVQHGLDMIIVDYLQLMRGNRMIDNRVQEVSEISRSLKGLARELNVPVLAVSQLSRAVEFRSSHEPQLSDLRESGTIEQDADVVMFVYREEYYVKEDEWAITHPEREYPREEADIIVAKHRNGPTDRIKLRFKHALAKFENYTEEPKTI